MPSDEPRADGQAALDAICAVADVDGFEWLPPRDGGTSDLRLRLADGRSVCVEITLAAVQAAEELKGAARKMRPYRAEELSWHWSVQVAACLRVSASTQH